MFVFHLKSLISNYTY